MEDQLRRYRDEDTDLHREIFALKAAHEVALRRAEEAGYAAGLRDSSQTHRGEMSMADMKEA